MCKQIFARVIGVFLFTIRHREHGQPSWVSGLGVGCRIRLATRATTVSCFSLWEVEVGWESCVGRYTLF